LTSFDDYYSLGFRPFLTLLSPFRFDVRLRSGAGRGRSRIGLLRARVGPVVVIDGAVEPEHLVVVHEHHRRGGGARSLGKLAERPLVVSISFLYLIKKILLNTQVLYKRSIDILLHDVLALHIVVVLVSIGIFVGVSVALVVTLSLDSSP
jgi:hypothetical protein